MVFIRFQISICFALALSSFAFCQIQPEAASKIFEEIPADRRAKLTERLNTFIELEREGDWDKSYEMISETFKQDVRGGFSLKEYKNNKGTKIKKFVVFGLSPANDQTIYAAAPIREIEGHYFINGCGSSKGGGKAAALIETYWENDNWYFSFMEFTGIGGKERCSPRIENQP